LALRRNPLVGFRETPEQSQLLLVYSSNTTFSGQHAGSVGRVAAQERRSHPE
jgi:hypothetical protein